MAITWIDGFDLYGVTADLSMRYTVTNTPSLVTGRLGSGKALRLANAGIQWATPAATATASFGAAMKITTLAGCGSGKEVMDFRNSTTNVCMLAVTSTGQIKIGGTDLAGGLKGTSAGVIFEATWCYIEIEITRSATVGVVNVYVNSVNVLSLTGLNLGALNIDNMRSPNSGDGVTLDWDDMYVTNVATKVGESRVDVIRPSADTATAQWTPLAGSHFSNVNTTAYDGDTTYNSDATIGNKDLFDVTDLAFTPTAVYAVQAVMCYRKDDVATRTIRSNVKSGATSATGATVGVPSSYVVTADIFETDPNTGAAWTVANVNAAQLGYETVS